MSSGANWKDAQELNPFVNRKRNDKTPPKSCIQIIVNKAVNTYKYDLRDSSKDAVVICQRSIIIFTNKTVFSIQNILTTSRKSII